MPLLVSDQLVDSLVTWTVATGVARPHSGISKLKVPAEEGSNEFIDLHMIEEFSRQLDSLPLDTLVFQEPGEQMVFYIPMYFEQKIRNNMVQRVDTRYRVCKDSRDLVKKFLTALSTWADQRPNGPAAAFLAKILSHPLLRRLRHPDECSRIISPIIGCGTNRRVRQSMAESEAFKEKMQRINASLNTVGFSAEYRPGNEKDKGLRVRRIDPVLPHVMLPAAVAAPQPPRQPPPHQQDQQQQQLPPHQQQQHPADNAKFLQTSFSGARRPGGSKPVSVRASKPEDVLLTADHGGLHAPTHDIVAISQQPAPMASSYAPATDAAPRPISSSQGVTLPSEAMDPAASLRGGLDGSGPQLATSMMAMASMEQGGVPHVNLPNEALMGNMLGGHFDPTLAANLTAAPQALNQTLNLTTSSMSHPDPSAAMYSSIPMPPRPRNSGRPGKRRNPDADDETQDDNPEDVPPNPEDVLAQANLMVAHSNAPYHLPQDQAQQFLQQMSLPPANSIDDSAVISQLIKFIGDIKPTLEEFSQRGLPTKPFLTMLSTMEQELRQNMNLDNRILSIQLMAKQCEIVLSKELIEAAISDEGARQFFSHFVPDFHTLLDATENDLITQAGLTAASKHNGDDNDDTGEPMAKRSHDGPPMMLMSVHQLVAIIRSQLVPRLVEPRHTNQLGLSQEFYEQINQLRSTMPLELMAASVLSVLSDVLNQPHA
eukprot:TRINITY_DN9177_c0_g1_i2.p1 TRINITY_DN9177_c0_g1~~TRINITY_DN9177_c0_g1_i2.p1  ORF type:complete len:712 (+),score=160.24 TRINITY_DN9177_c0_g1_i2:135-2270(+)